MISDAEIAQFEESALEGIIKKISEKASWALDDSIESSLLDIVKRYNSYSGALCVNALNVLLYAVEKDKKTFQTMVLELDTYDFPVPEIISEDDQYRHPELRSKLARKQQGTLESDRTFFTGLYDRLGVKPKE